MSNNTEYHVTFSYDLTQTGGRKYDSYLKMTGEKYGAKFDKIYEDDYGLKDLVFTSINDLNKLNDFIKVVFQDLSKKDVRVSASANKYEYVLKIDNSNIKNKQEFVDFIKEWIDDKNVSVKNLEKTVDVVFPNKELKEEFTNNVLSKTASYTKNNKTCSTEDDWETTPQYNKDNFTEKHKHRI